MIIKPLMRAKEYTDQDITGWYMSEKLDGVWARYMDGKFYSRLGNRFQVPEWFCRELPKGIILDGELYAGRGTFQYVTGIVRKNKPIDREWKGISYQIFDCPSPLPFKKRYELMVSNIKGDADSVVVYQQPVASTFWAKGYYEAVLEYGAEGVMFKDPTAPYVHGKVSTFLKWKPNVTEEATVLDYSTGEGKYIGCVGALICSWKNLTISIGSGLSDAQRKDPPKKGSIITFKYGSLTDGGMPRFPRFVAVRNYE